MVKNVALSDEIIKELNHIKKKHLVFGQEQSYSEIIKLLLKQQPKTKTEKINATFEPFRENIVRLISNDMVHPLEVLRVICIRIVIRRNPQDIKDFTGILEEYLNKLKIEEYTNETEESK